MMITESEALSDTTLLWLKQVNPMFFSKEAKKVFKDMSYHVSIPKQEMTIYRKNAPNMIYVWGDDYELTFSHFVDGNNEIPSLNEFMGSHNIFKLKKQSKMFNNRSELFKSRSA